MTDNPKLGSVNDVMSRAKADVFTVTLSDLQKHDEWRQSFLRGIEYFEIGALYNNKPSDYYLGPGHNKNNLPSRYVILFKRTKEPKITYSGELRWNK